MGHESNPFFYSMAVFNCVAVAVLTFFFPLGVGSKLWSIIVIGILVICCCILFLKRDELKEQSGRTFNTTFALVMSYALEVVLVAMPIVISIGASVGGASAANSAISLSSENQDAFVHLANSYVYLAIFMLHLQNAVIGLLAEEQGRRANFVTITGLLGGLAYLALFYMTCYDIFPSIVIPAWTQPLGFLLLIPGLLRLRVLESYGHI